MTTETKVIKYPHVTVELTGVDGNVFVIIGVMCKALRKHVSSEAATQFASDAMSLSTYDEVLCLCMETVNVE